MAAPHIAGIAALYLQDNGNALPYQARANVCMLSWHLAVPLTAVCTVSSLQRNCPAKFLLIWHLAWYPAPHCKRPSLTILCVARCLVFELFGVMSVLVAVSNFLYC